MAKNKDTEKAPVRRTKPSRAAKPVKDTKKIVHGVDGPWTKDEDRFVLAYFAHDMNKAAAAAALFGCKDEQARTVGDELFRVPHVRKAITKLFSKGLAETNVTIHQELLERWRIQAFTDRSTIYDEDTWAAKPLREWSLEQRMLLESVSYQTTADGKVVAAPKLVSQDRAMLALAKAAGVLLSQLDGALNDFEGEVRSVKAKVAKAALKAASAIAKARAKADKAVAKAAEVKAQSEDGK